MINLRSYLSQPHKVNRTESNNTVINFHHVPLFFPLTLFVVFALIIRLISHYTSELHVVNHKSLYAMVFHSTELPTDLQLLAVPPPQRPRPRRPSGSTEWHPPPGLVLRGRTLLNQQLKLWLFKTIQINAQTTNARLRPEIWPAGSFKLTIVCPKMIPLGAMANPPSTWPRLTLSNAGTIWSIRPPINVRRCPKAATGDSCAKSIHLESLLDMEVISLCQGD